MSEHPDDLNIPYSHDGSPPIPGAARSSLVRIEGYEIFERLGDGGMGEVFKARQLSTGRLVAVKILRENLAGSRRAEIRFSREVELTARLKHPFIAGVFDSGIHENRFYYAMEFIEGIPLSLHVQKKSPTVAQMLGIMADVCQAVHYAHQQQVLHRDIKPSNILITPDGRPHLVDFGVATLINPVDPAHTLSKPGDIVGTIEYMSPEQARGEVDRIDVRSEVYTLGVVLHQLLTGHFPHGETGTEFQTRTAIAKGEIFRPRKHNPAIKGELEAILMKALELEPQRRYPSVDAFEMDLRNYLSGDPVSAKPMTLGYLLKKRVQKYPGRTASIAGVTALLLAIGLYAWFAVTHERDQALVANIRKSISLARMYFESDRTAEARNELRSIPPEHRRFEWHMLDYWTDQRVWSLPMTDVWKINFTADGSLLLVQRSGDKVDILRFREDGPPEPLRSAGPFDLITADSHHALIELPNFTGVILDVITGDPLCLVEMANDAISLAQDRSNPRFGYRIAVSPDRKYAAIIAGYAFRLYDTKTNGMILSRAYHDRGQYMWYSADSDRLYVYIPPRVNQTEYLDLVKLTWNDFPMPPGTHHPKLIDHGRHVQLQLNTVHHWIWSLKEPEREFPSYPETEMIRVSLFHPNRNAIFYATEGRSLKNWNLDKNRIEAEYRGVKTPFLEAAIHPGRRFLVAFSGRALHCWDRDLPHDGMEFHNIGTAHSNRHLLCKIPDRSTELTISIEIQHICIHDRRSGKLHALPLAKIPAKLISAKTGKPYTPGFRSAAFLPKSPGGPANNMAILLDTSGFLWSMNLDLPNLDEAWPEPWPVKSPAWGPRAGQLIADSQGRWLGVLEGRQTHFFDPKSGKPVATIKGGARGMFNPAEDRFTALIYEGTGESMTADIVHYDTSTWTQTGRFRAPQTSFVWTYSPDGDRIALGHKDGSVELREARGGALLFSAQPTSDIIKCLAFSPEADRLLVGSESLHLLDAMTGQEVLTFPWNHQAGKGFDSVRFSEDGKQVIATVGSRMLIYRPRLDRTKTQAAPEEP